MARSVPNVNCEGVSFGVVSIKTVIAGSKSIGDLVLEVAVEEDLNETGFAYVWVREKYLSHLAISLWGAFSLLYYRLICRKNPFLTKTKDVFNGSALKPGTPSPPFALSSSSRSSSELSSLCYPFLFSQSTVITIHTRSSMLKTKDVLGQATGPTVRSL